MIIWNMVSLIKRLIILFSLILVIILFFIFINKLFFKNISTNNLNLIHKSMQLTSPSFAHNEKIPVKYTCDGESINPPLQIAGVPAEAKSLVLIVDDPDAPMGTWVHWLMWNIAPTQMEIAENSVPTGVGLGVNGRGKFQYGPPCPPSGTHRYFFKLYALDTVLTLPEGSSKAELENALQDHVIDSAELIGLYR